METPWVERDRDSHEIEPFIPQNVGLKPWCVLFGVARLCEHVRVTRVFPELSEASTPEGYSSPSANAVALGMMLGSPSAVPAQQPKSKSSLDTALPVSLRTASIYIRRK